MRLLLISLIFGLGVASGNPAGASTTETGKASPHASKAKKSKKAKLTKVKKGRSVKTSQVRKKEAKPDLQTDVKFDDSVLHGQYQTPDEALANVENEKGLSDLIGVRKHFKDRLATAAEQE